MNSYGANSFAAQSFACVSLRGTSRRRAPSSGGGGGGSSGAWSGKPQRPPWDRGKVTEQFHAPKIATKTETGKKKQQSVFVLHPKQKQILHSKEKRTMFVLHGPEPQTPPAALGTWRMPLPLPKIGRYVAIVGGTCLGVWLSLVVVGAIQKKRAERKKARRLKRNKRLARSRR